MKRNLSYLTCVVIMMSLLLYGCTSQPKENEKEKEIVQVSTDYLQIMDDIGRTVILTKKPQRIVVLSPLLLDTLYGVGGKAIGRASSKTFEIYPSSQMAGEVGFEHDINFEQLISLQPDLVIGVQDSHDELIPILENSKIPVIILKIRTYEDILRQVKLLGDIAGTPIKAQSLIDKMQMKISAVMAKLPAVNKKVVILHVTAKDVTVELDTSVAGNIAKMLRMKNIAVGSHPLESDPDMGFYSVEKLVEGDADVIMVVTKGNRAEIESMMKDEIGSDPAWAKLRGVQNGQVLFLPSEFFQLNPGIRFHEAIDYMAKVVYPDIYGNAN